MMRRNAISFCLGLALFAVEARATWTVSTTSINFGTQTVGAPPQYGQTLIVTNTGTTTFTLQNVTIPSPFILKAGAVPYTMSPGAYAPATFSFGFVPTAPGSYSGNIVISFSDGTSATIALSGTAVTTNAAVTFTPSTLTFASQAVAVPSAAQNITITNTGTDTVNVLGYQVIPSVFSQSPAAATKISPGAQIQVPVTFTPKVPGKISGNLNVQFDVLPSIGISLTGTGIAPAGLSISSFPTLPDASANATYQAFLTSHGGTAPITWSLASGTLPPGLTLSSSTGVISGTPTANGSKTFTVRATDAGSK